MIDVHAHILPGVDDGARSLGESLVMAREMVSQGVEAVIATPHYINETNYTSTRAENLRLLFELREQLAAAGVPLKVFLGNEIYIDPAIWELGRAGEIAALASSRYLLVELPMSGEFPGFEDILLDLKLKGCQVILAHPERYAAVQKDFGIVERLSRDGVLLQCNLGSFNGRYGRRAEKVARELAARKMIFALGSDMHRPGRGDEISRARERLREFYDEDELEQILTINPLKILRNQ